MERTRLRLFQFSLRDQANNWLERLPAGSISTWEDLTTRFLAQFFPPRRTAKLRNDILMFQQHHGESILEAWTRFKDLLQKVPHHGIDLWLQVKMDNPKITMEEYIRLEEEKAHRRGKVYNWETATYGKIWDNKDVHDLGYVETEFPAIVFNDMLTSEALLCEP
ncbi:zinc finger, CCHC-type containing protein [Tanacetum coccineum]